jgi:hypothetical protein
MDVEPLIFRVIFDSFLDGEFRIHRQSQTFFAMSDGVHRIAGKTTFRTCSYIIIKIFRIDLIPGDLFTHIRTAEKFRTGFGKRHTGGKNDPAGLFHIHLHGNIIQIRPIPG